MPRQKKPIYLRLAVTKYSKEINEMTDTVKTVKDYEGKEVTLTANPEDATSGKLVESFTITVKTTDKDTKEETTHYKSEAEPFEWTKVDNIADVLRGLGGEVSDDAVAFIGEALPGEKNGEAIKALVELYNKNERANAKNNAYQRIVNKFTPQTAEDIEKAFNRMAEIFSKQAGVTLDMAKTMLRNAQASAKSQAA